MTSNAGGRATRVQRAIGLVWLLVAGAVTLPLAAALLDGPSAENLVLPALAPRDASRGRALLVGSGLGILAALVGTALFWFLLNGLGGA